ncbi:MAG TPA: response regulator [Gemmatimonadaceae bacterium]
MPAAESNRLLLVDDDDLIAVALQDYLTMRGCEVDTAHNYDAAKSMIGAREYAVAVTDVVVTGAGIDAGTAFLSWLRETAPRTAVIVLTGYRTAWLERFTRNLGITHFFDKPPHFADIVDALSALTFNGSKLSGRNQS